jgi:hypothetical protein
MSNTTAIPALPAPSPVPSYVESVIAGQVRHVLSGTGASLVISGIASAGGLDTEAVTKIVTGAIIYGASAGWSWWQKSGPAFVAAQLARLKSHVAAIPTVPSSLPQAAAINASIETAQVIAEGPQKH